MFIPSSPGGACRQGPQKPSGPCPGPIRFPYPLLPCLGGSQHEPRARSGGNLRVFYCPPGPGIHGCAPWLIIDRGGDCAGLASFALTGRPTASGPQPARGGSCRPPGQAVDYTYAHTPYPSGPCPGGKGVCEHPFYTLNFVLSTVLCGFGLHKRLDDGEDRLYLGGGAERGRVDRGETVC